MLGLESPGPGAGGPCRPLPSPGSAGAAVPASSFSLVQQPDLLLLLLQLHLLCDHLELFRVHVGLQERTWGWSSGAQGGALHIFRVETKVLHRSPAGPTLTLSPQAVPSPCLPPRFQTFASMVPPGAPSSSCLHLTRVAMGWNQPRSPLADAHRSDVAFTTDACLQ